MAEERTLRRVGIYGGTFNPIHFGHLRAAEEAREALGLERVLFVPSAVPPHKTHEPDDPVAPGAERLAWVRLAIADHPHFEADPVEVERGGASYLVDTLRTLRARLAAEQAPGGPAAPVFLIGHDAFAEMDAWRAPHELLALADWAVIVRPPAREPRLAAWLPAAARDAFELAPDGRSGRHRRSGTRLEVVEIAGFDISASDLRRRIRAGRSVRYLLPEPVRRAVLASSCYGPRGASGARASGRAPAPKAGAGASGGASPTEGPAGSCAAGATGAGPHEPISEARSLPASSGRERPRRGASARG